MLNNLILEWQQLRAKLDALKHLSEQEQQLRQRLVALAFPGGDEGTQTLELNNNWKLKCRKQLYRTVDETALAAVREQLEEMDVNTDELIDFKPVLNLKPYRALTDEQRHAMDQALVIKPGMPSLELVAPNAKEE